MSDEGAGRRPPLDVPQNVKPSVQPNVQPNVKPNVKPKMNEKGAELRTARSRSISWERRGRRRERQRGERKQRGRSEEARGRHGKRVASERGRGRGKEEEEEEDEECAVCFCSYDNVFKAPKLLACGHTFCLECLARINVTSPDLTAVSCPVCREPTRLPHGRDLPRLGTNSDIIGRLPPGMRRALSVRFKRSKGKLLLKTPPPHGGGAASPAAELPVKSSAGVGEAAVGSAGDPQPSAMEQGGLQPTMVDVGRPPSRVRGRLRRLLRSDHCYYAVVGTIITVTVTLMLVGILAFVIIPRVPRPPRPPQPNNQTGPP